MSDLKAQLIKQLRLIDGLEDRPSPVSGGSALFYHGKEFAHFHDDHELDLRLTARVIKAQGLSHPTGSKIHPTRSKNSPWIEIRYRNTQDLPEVSRLVRLAIQEL